MRTLIVELPDVAEGVAEAEIAEWRVSVDDLVLENQILAAVVTDKATVEIPSPASGRVIRLGAAVGEHLSVGAALVVLDLQTEAERDPNPAPTRAAARPAMGRPGGSPSIGKTGGGDEEKLTPPGPEIGRQREPSSRRPKSGALRGIAPDVEIVGDRPETAPLVPQFSGFEEVDMTACDELRARLNSKWRRTKGELSISPFVIRAIVVALRDHPDLNARYDDARGVVIPQETVNVGVSLGGSASGLRDAGSLTLWECERELRARAAGPVDDGFDPDRVSRPTITIVSLGDLGGLAVFPLIGAGEVAILGVNRFAIRPAWREDRFEPRKMMNLTGSFDQRVIQMEEAARFLGAIKQLLESPAEMFIEP